MKNENLKLRIAQLKAEGTRIREERQLREEQLRERILKDKLEAEGQ